jgi:NADH:ubiquinone oxidoreductase subunit 5 (subunit L)/multisubunit Na+/H+ antiporter MnhA subunit
MGISFMFVGFGDPQLAFIHIAAHAVFKSLLFWGVGLVNHDTRHQYTVSDYSVTVVSYTAVVVSLLSLLGTPFLSGFYTKELMLVHGGEVEYVFFIVVVVQLVSVFYNTRLLFLICFTGLGLVSYIHRTVECAPTLAVLLFIASVLSVFAGYFSICEYSSLAYFWTFFGAGVTGVTASLIADTAAVPQLFAVLPWGLLILFFSMRSQTATYKIEVTFKLIGRIRTRFLSIYYGFCFLEVCALAIERFFVVYITYDNDSLVGDY